MNCALLFLVYSIVLLLVLPLYDSRSLTQSSVDYVEDFAVNYSDPPPYAKPIYEPTTFPTSRPTSAPTSRPSSIQPSSTSTFFPTSRPTSAPTSRPSSIQPSSPPSTSCPTSPPSTSAPSTLQPSSLPTSYVKTDFPSNLPTTIHYTSEPTNTPSFDPTQSPAPPTSLPTASPSRQPSSKPSSRPTKHTDQPTSNPTSRPSMAPTPSGIAGKDWWYLLTTQVTLYSFISDTFSADDMDSIIDALNDAFIKEYSESLTVAESETITALVDSLQNYKQSPFLRYSTAAVSPAIHIEDASSTTNYTAKFILKAWAPTRHIQRKLYWKTLTLQENPDPILLILHEEDFRDISDVRLSSLQTTTTTSAPPEEDSNLSPDRIIYIIIGTIVVFTIGACILGGCFKVASKARQAERGVELRDIDGDVVMTEQRSSSSPQRRRSSPLGSPHRSPKGHGRQSTAPSNVISPLHASSPQGKNKPRQPQHRRFKDEEEEASFADFADFGNPNDRRQQQPPLDLLNTPPPLQATSTHSNNSKTPASTTRMLTKEEEDVFDFRFDDFNDIDNDHNHRRNNSSKYSMVSNANSHDDDDDNDYDLDDGDADVVSSPTRRAASSSSFSFFSNFSNAGRGRGGKKKNKGKVDYESLVF